MRKPPKRVSPRAARLARGSHDPAATFLATAGALLEIAVSHFKAGDSDSALEFIRKAVELCEQNPVHALSRSSDRESSLQQIIQGMLRNAIAKRPSADQWKALLGRIQALNVTSIH